MRITESQLAFLTARVERVQRVVGCLGAFERCWWSTDLDRAHKALQEALQSEPQPNL